MMTHDEASELLGRVRPRCRGRRRARADRGPPGRVPALSGRARRPPRRGGRPGQLGRAAPRGAVVEHRQPAARPARRRAAAHADSGARRPGPTSAPAPAADAAPPRRRAAPARRRASRVEVACSRWRPSPWRPPRSPPSWASTWSTPTTRSRTCSTRRARPPRSCRPADARPQGGQPRERRPRRAGPVRGAPDGQGYLVKSDLPTLSSAKTYQLWGVINGQPISLGLLGQAPHGGRLHLGRVATTLQAGHHGRAGRRFGGADRPMLATGTV